MDKSQISKKGLDMSENFSKSPLENIRRGTIYVEDIETASYLSKLFKDRTSEVRFSVAGGCEGVMIRVAADNSNNSGVLVCGIVDRDYGPDRSSKWGKPKTRTFYLKRHEIENYALDWQLLASVIDSGSVGHHDIEEFVRSIATDYIYTVACNMYLAELERTIRRKRPCEKTVYPKRIADLSAVERENVLKDCDETVRYIEQSEIVSYVQTEGRDALNGDAIRMKICDLVYKIKQSLESNEWIDIFPGKELLKSIRCRWMASMSDEDFIKSIGDAQSKNPPSDLKTIIDKICSRMYSINVS